MNTQLIEFLIDNEFETLQDAVSFYNTFGAQTLDYNTDSFKPVLAKLVRELSARGQLDTMLGIINKNCLYNNELAQYAKALVHDIKFKQFSILVESMSRDAEMMELINGVK